MNRLTDERLEAIRTYLVSGYSNLRERALCECIAQLLAEVDRLGRENNDLWADYRWLSDELSYYQNTDCSVCGGT